MSGVVGAVTGFSSALVAGFITTTDIKHKHRIRQENEKEKEQPTPTNDSPNDLESFFYSLGYSAASGIACGTIGGIISDRKINDSGFIGGIIGGIVAGIASGVYGTWDFLYL